MQYYVSDAEIVYAVDENGKVYSVGKDGLKPSDYVRPDPMWSGITAEEMKFYLS